VNTDLLISITAFTVLTLLWLGFAAALAFDRELLDRLWRRFRGWNIAFKLLAVLLFLPVVLGLWVWEQHWPFWLRLFIILALAWMTEYTFFPHFLLG
jgi:hypothetical protein